MAKHYLSLDPFLPWRQAERPVNWEARFGRKAPLEIEIGFGNGERLARRAAAHPELDFVGLDISWPSVRRALRKAALAGMRNLLIVQADAHVALAALFRPRQIQRASALFPCPWPEEKQEGKRLFSRNFFKALNNRLADGGGFFMVSDHKVFFEWAAGQADQCGFDVSTGLRGPGLETKYERKWLDAGQKRFYEMSLLKREHLEAPAWEEFDLRAYRLKDFDPERFQCKDHVGEERVSFKRLVFDPKMRMGLLHTVVVEGPLQQVFWLEFSWQGEYWSLRPALGCGLAPTRGVKKALELAWLEAGGAVED